MPSERLARLEEKVETTQDMVKDIHTQLCGSPGTDGLVTRVSKLESKQAFHSKLSWAGFAAILSITIAFFKSKM
ncbi:hypothetical protein LCGC14_1061040 [marine sediment metagenome]|uniref:Uncharacterized protein n=1 Tax=marine sediment metagenome TaxID=412755 RepID=A0A0F9Q415_9ZZZZ